MKRYLLISGLLLSQLFSGAGSSAVCLAQPSPASGIAPTGMDTLATVDGISYGLSYENEENFGNAVLVSSKGLRLPLPPLTNVEARGEVFCLTVGVERLARPFFKLSRKTDFFPNNYPKAFRRLVSRAETGDGATGRSSYASLVDYCTLPGAQYDWVRAYQENIADVFAQSSFAQSSGTVGSAGTDFETGVFVFEQLAAASDPANSQGEQGQARLDACASRYADGHSRPAATGEEHGSPAHAFLFQYPRLVTPEAVTLLTCTSRYGGGTQGCNTLSYVTLDLSTRRPLTFGNTFLPEARERVLAVLLAVMGQQKARATGSDFNPQFDVHNPAILKGGVAFSFQAGEVACLADGDNHFFIPFELLSGCFTPEARRIIASIR